MSAEPNPASQNKPAIRAESNLQNDKNAIAALENEGAKTMKQTADSLNHMGGQYMAMCSDMLATAVESGTQASKAVSEMSKSYLDACNNQATTMADIGRESLSCRTSADFVKVQKRAMEGMTTGMEALSKLYADMFAAYAQTMGPLFARTTDAPERLFRAFAA